MSTFKFHVMTNFTSRSRWIKAYLMRHLWDSKFIFYQRTNILTLKSLNLDLGVLKILLTNPKTSKLYERNLSEVQTFFRIYTAKKTGL